jgi:hypothetical protein
LTFELTCIACKAATLLCPAAPIVRRQTIQGYLHFYLHGEGSESGGFASALKDGGAYHVQWRQLEAGEEQPGKDEGWRDPKRLIKPSSIISKMNLDPKSQWQVRVRARLGPWMCGSGGESARQYCDYIACAAEDNAHGCSWTPWSPPSAPATPGAGDEVGDSA